MPVPGWRLRTWRAASIPSRWKVGGIRISVTTTWGWACLGRRHQLVVVGGHTHDLEVGLEPEEGPHALAHQHVVVRQHHGDPSRNGRAGTGAAWPSSGITHPSHQIVPRLRKGARTRGGVVLARPADDPASALGRTTARFVP